MPARSPANFVAELELGTLCAGEAGGSVLVIGLRLRLAVRFDLGLELLKKSRHLAAGAARPAKEKTQLALCTTAAADKITLASLEPDQCKDPYH